MKIDFHIHTYYSDGTMSPEEVVTEAKKQGLDAIAITDHNQLGSWEELKSLGETYALQVIRGVEINCKHKGKEYHLLGYGFESTKTLIGLIDKASFELERMNRDLIQKLEQEYPIISMHDYEAYRYDRSKGGWKSLHYLLDKGLTETLFEGFKFYKSHGCDFLDYDFPELEILCKAIKEAGGVSVIAHPGEYDKEASIEQVLALVEDFNKVGIQGVECYYPTHSKALTEALVAFCEAQQLLMTMGSDEHGAFGKQAKRIPQTIGCISKDLVGFDIKPFLV